MWTILVVEDSSTMRELIGFAVRRLGDDIHIVDAEHGADAMEKLGALMPDLVITDLNMPVMPGMVLIQRIRADPRLAHIPIVIITTETNAEERDEAMALGANAYVTKPIKAPQVVETLKLLLPELAGA